MWVFKFRYETQGLNNLSYNVWMQETVSLNASFPAHAAFQRILPQVN